MRTLTARDVEVLKTPKYKVSRRVKVEDYDGAMQNLASYFGYNWLKSIVYSDSVDQPVASANIVLFRNAYWLSLANSTQNSALNKNAAGAYAPLLEPGRLFTIETATIPEGYTAAESDYIEVLRGRIDSVDWGGTESLVTIFTRDLSGILQDTFVESEASYGANDGSKLAENVIQDLNTAWATGLTLYTPVASAFAIRLYNQQKEPLMQPIQNIAAQRGWLCKYKWDSGTNAFRLTFYDPGRTTSTVDYTFSYNQTTSAKYFRPTQLRKELSTIRTVVKVVYTDSTDLVRKSVSYPENGTASAGGATTLTDSSRAWSTNEWQTNYKVHIVSGTGIGQIRTVMSNTATELTVAAWTTQPDTTSKYAIVHIVDDATPLQDAPVGYGRRYMELAEAGNSQVDSKAEAFTMARSVYNDVSQPYAVMEIPVRYFFPVELCDFYTFKANVEYFDTDLNFAVVGYRHTLSVEGDQETCETVLTLRSKPSAGLMKWLSRESRTGVAPPNDFPSTPTGLSLTTATESVEQTTTSYILAEWTKNPEPNIDYYQVRYRKGTGDYIYMTSPAAVNPSLKISGLIGNVSYGVQTRALNLRGRSSDWCTEITQTTAKDNTAPSTPTGLSATSIIKGASVSWTANSEADFSAYELHISTSSGFTPTSPANNPADWDGSTNTLIWTGNATKKDLTQLVSGTTYYTKIKAYDTSGNISSASSEINITAGKADTANLTTEALTGYGFTDFYFHTTFESLDSFNSSTQFTGSITNNKSNIKLATGTTNNSFAELARIIDHSLTLPNWGVIRKYKTVIKVGDNPSSLLAYLGIGNIKRVIFKFDGTSLKGESYNTAPNEVDLSVTLSAGTKYLLEATITASDIKWYINGVLKGTSTTQVPQLTANANQVFWLYVSNTTAVNTYLEISEYVFLQDANG